MPITKAQADILKALVDEDANLAGANLKLEAVPNYHEFVYEWTQQHPEPNYTSDGWEAWEEWKTSQDAAWIEEVNGSLLPEKVIGACVIGGFAIAALKAGHPIKLYELTGNTRPTDLEFSVGLGSLNYDLRVELEKFTGMTYEELYQCQRVNDTVRSDAAHYFSLEADYRDVENPVYGKSEEEVTAHRRERLKSYIDSITITT